MLSELATIREHWVRYREVTVQQLDRLAEEHLAWRPQPELFSVGQHFVHILQTEKYYARGLFHQDWDTARLHFPASLPAISNLRSDFTATRAQTLADFDRLIDADLVEVKLVPNAPVQLPLRWWLWFVLEHEIHHKAQLALYVRQLGKVPPFFAMILADRPDIRIRSEWGGIQSRRSLGSARRWHSASK
ncbi:MAG: DinB family protein [Acidobacteriota bacterium]